jgi:hypothetical protein
MFNMDYCAFENTLRALHQAEEKLEVRELSEWSQEEADSAWRLVRLCERIGRRFDHEDLKRDAETLSFEEA